MFIYIWIVNMFVYRVWFMEWMPSLKKQIGKIILKVFWYKGYVNYPYLQPVTELHIRTQIKVIKLKGIVKTPLAAAVWQLTTDHSLGLGVYAADLIRKSLRPGHTAHDNDTITIQTISFGYWIHVSCHTATYRSSVTGNMQLIGERYFLYRYRVQCARAFSDSWGIGLANEEIFLLELRNQLHISIKYRTTV